MASPSLTWKTSAVSAVTAMVIMATSPVMAMDEASLQQWQTQLDRREQQVRDREAKLGIHNDAMNVSSVGSTLVFEDTFSDFDLNRWKHEITLGGGGNWEFQMYINNRTNSFVRDNVLYLKPTLTSDTIGDQAVIGAIPTTMDMWGNQPADVCTGEAFYGCSRASGGGIYLNPIQSARIRTAGTFSFKYGRLEIEAKLPKGDWIWPAMWLLPETQAYGKWPASGEIDMIESRGNSPSYPSGGYDTVQSSLHFGPYYPEDPWSKAHGEYKLSGSDFSQAFHIFGLYWDENGMYTYVDDDSNRLMSVDFTKQSFFELGEWSSSTYNPWANRPNAAPFDQPFYLVFNVAVGGVSGFFPDGEGGKTWSDKTSVAMEDFWNSRGSWLPSWVGDDVALKIKSVRVWQ